MYLFLILFVSFLIIYILDIINLISFRFRSIYYFASFAYFFVFNFYIQNLQHQFFNNSLSLYIYENKNMCTLPQILLAGLGGAALMRKLLHHGSTVASHTQYYDSCSYLKHVILSSIP